MRTGGNWDAYAAQAEHIGPDDTGDNINAKRSANYVWNGSSWQRMTQPGEVATKTERYDYDSAPIIYTATADVGTLDNATGWTIIKYDLTSGSNASGKVATDVSWDNRATGTYA